MKADAPERPESPSEGLRATLRAATALPHERLDRLMSGLDIAEPAGRRRFSIIMFRGYLRLGAACGWDAAEGTRPLGRLLRALWRDEVEPGERNARLEADAPLERDAAAYIVLGSQFGLGALRSRLPAEGRSGLFAVEADAAGWRAFRRRTAGPARAADEEARVVSDAIRGFGIFLEEASATMKKASRVT